MVQREARDDLGAPLCRARSKAVRDEAGGPAMHGRMAAGNLGPRALGAHCVARWPLPPPLLVPGRQRHRADCGLHGGRVPGIGNWGGDARGHGAAPHGQQHCCPAQQRVRVQGLGSGKHQAWRRAPGVWWQGRDGVVLRPWPVTFMRPMTQGPGGLARVERVCHIRCLDPMSLLLAPNKHL